MALPDDLLAGNAAFAEAFDAGGLPRPPRRSLAILTCMDARLEPLRALGLALGDAHVLRNAGARATEDVVRSLVVAQRLLGVREVLVVGHSDCGLEGVSEADLRAKAGTDAVEFDPFPELEEGVRETVRRLSAEPLLDGLEASGAIYEVETGRLRALG